MYLSKALTLPCGQTLKNRFGKSAMSEILGTYEHAPSPSLARAYKRWSEGDCGLLITGNVMVDRKALGEPKNVVVEDERHLSELQQWAHVAKKHDVKMWVQINHPGKQSPGFLSSEPVAPSAIPLDGFIKAGFNNPRALTSDEVWMLVERFATTARIVKKAGFDGVQVHGAHGYLVSQFLSPRHNVREDEWGGSTEKRAKFALEIYKAIRREVGPSFPVSIKLNSSDFQKGGFEQGESLAIIQALCLEGIDLVEISGGSYERPAMMGSRKASTEKREAYFSDFAQKIRAQTKVPLMLTGGFRTAKAMEAALESDICDLVGLARPLALDPDLPKKILSGDMNYKSSVGFVSTGIKALDAMSILNITWYEQQIAYLGRGQEPNAKLNPYLSILKTFSSIGMATFRKRRA